MAAKVQPKKHKGVILTPQQVILRPLVTEKGTHRSTRHNQYTFEVDTSADKTQIGDAVEHLFNVKVVKVRTQTRKGKERRYKMKRIVTKAWKKAIVTLAAENRIDFF